MSLIDLRKCVLIRDLCFDDTTLYMCKINGKIPLLISHANTQPRASFFTRDREQAM